MKTWMKWLFFSLALLIFVTFMLVHVHTKYISERTVKADNSIEVWYDYFEEIKADAEQDISPYYMLYTVINSADYDYTPEQQDKVDALKEMILSELEAGGVNLEKEN